LFLFVTGIFANDADDAFAPHDAAGFAESFDGGSDFHGSIFRRLKPAATF
jgi:hypothetical protein